MSDRLEISLTAEEWDYLHQVVYGYDYVGAGGVPVHVPGLKDETQYDTAGLGSPGKWKNRGQSKIIVR